MANDVKFKLNRNADFIQGDKKMTELYFNGPDGSDLRMVVPVDSTFGNLDLGEEFTVCFINAAGLAPAKQAAKK